MAEAWPDEIDLLVTGIAQGGDGVGRWHGRAVFAAGGLPGEEVRVRLRDRQAAFARGDVVAVKRAAPERRVSPCRLEDRCSAAGWRWIDYRAQLRFKAAILQDQLRHLAGIDVEVAVTWGMEPDAAIADSSSDTAWGYRTTVELHARGDKLGYFARDSQVVVDIPRCCLHHPLIDGALAVLRPLLADPIPFRALNLRCAAATQQVLAIFDGADMPQDLVQRWARAYPPLAGVVQQTRSRREVLYGQDYLVQQMHGIRWHVGAGSFFQVNAQQTERLIERVLTLLDPREGQRLLDLFCGVGTFALPLARQGSQVAGVESFAPAIDDARRSALLNGIERVCWHAGPVEQVLATLAGPFDGAVLDPPRRGCHPHALEQLLRLRPARIVYVACHPGTLARDCKTLAAGGYTVERAEVIDLFPQTHHVESIVVLTTG